MRKESHERRILHEDLRIHDYIISPCCSMCLMWCILKGNDMIPQEMLTLFHKQFIKPSDQSNRPGGRLPAEILIPKVANFIACQPPFEQLMTQLPQLAKWVHSSAFSTILLWINNFIINNTKNALLNFIINWFTLR